MAKKKTFNVDFQRLSSNSYKNASKLGKDVLDSVTHNPDPLGSEESPNVDLLKCGLDSLTPKQKTVIMYLFGINSPLLTIQEVADKLGISRQGVSSLKQAALKNLRKTLILNKKTIKNIL